MNKFDKFDIIMTILALIFGLSIAGVAAAAMTKPAISIEQAECHSLGGYYTDAAHGACYYAGQRMTVEELKAKLEAVK